MKSFLKRWAKPAVPSPKSAADLPLPHLNAPLIPGKSAAGFELGMNFSEVFTKIALQQKITVPSPPGDWPGVMEAYRTSDGWLFHAYVWNGAFPDWSDCYPRGEECHKWLIFNGAQVMLHFGKTDLLQDIFIGDGYLQKFGGIGAGDKVRKIGKGYTVDFNSHDDDFFVKCGEAYVEGVQFMTTHRADLDQVPDQKVTYIVIRDYSLGRTAAENERLEKQRQEAKRAFEEAEAQRKIDQATWERPYSSIRDLP
jgi:hypothetical protein